MTAQDSRPVRHHVDRVNYVPSGARRHLSSAERSVSRNWILRGGMLMVRAPFGLEFEHWIQYPARTGMTNVWAVMSLPVLALAALGCTKSNPPTPGAEAVSSVPTAPTANALAHSLGMLIVGNDYDEVFPAGRSLPALFSDKFATSEDGQTTIHLALGQKRSAGIERVCDLTVEGIPAGKKATESVIVTIEIDPQKRLTAKVRVQSTGKDSHFGPFIVD